MPVLRPAKPAAVAIVCVSCKEYQWKVQQHCVRQYCSVQVVTEPGQADFILAHGTEVRVAFTESLM